MPKDIEGRTGLFCALLCLLTALAMGATGEIGLVFPAAALWFCSYACHDWRKEEQRIRERDALWDRRLCERLGIR